MGAVSIVLYVVMNYISAGNVIADAVTALGVMIAFYYGLTGFACVWYYRKDAAQTSARNLWMRGILPLLGGRSSTSRGLQPLPVLGNAGTATRRGRCRSSHWHIGGVFLIGVGSIVVGIVAMFVYRRCAPPFFRGEVLNRNTATLVPEDIGTPVGYSASSRATRIRSAQPAVIIGVPRAR